MTLGDFLKREFNIPTLSTSNENDVESFRVEKIKSNLTRNLNKNSKLSKAVENSLAKDDKKVDIDDVIEAKWNSSFKRIKNELLNIDEVLNTNKGIVKKTKKISESKEISIKEEHELYILDYSWFIKLSAACVIVLMLAVSTTTFAPNFSNSLTNAVKSSFDFDFRQNQDSRLTKESDTSLLSRRSTISKEAMSEYVINNKSKLEKLNDGDLVPTGLGGSSRQGRVAGVSHEYAENDENIFLLFLKKIIKIN